MVSPFIVSNPATPAEVFKTTAGKLPDATAAGVLMAIVPAGSPKNISAVTPEMNLNELADAVRPQLGAPEQITTEPASLELNENATGSPATEDNAHPVISLGVMGPRECAAKSIYPVIFSASAVKLTV
jgi:hypothetical protein